MSRVVVARKKVERLKEIEKERKEIARLQAYIEQLKKKDGAPSASAPSVSSVKSSSASARGGGVPSVNATGSAIKAPHAAPVSQAGPALRSTAHGAVSPVESLAQARAQRLGAAAGSVSVPPVAKSAALKPNSKLSTGNSGISKSASLVAPALGGVERDGGVAVGDLGANMEVGRGRGSLFLRPGCYDAEHLLGCFATKKLNVQAEHPSGHFRRFDRTF